MGPLENIGMGQLSVIVGIVTAVAWIVIPGTIAIVISIVAGGLIALRSMSDIEESSEPTD